MLTNVRNWSLRLCAASLVFATLPVLANDTEGVVQLNQEAASGVVRISDAQLSDEVVRGQSCPPSYGNACPNGCPTDWLSRNLYCCKLRQQHACAVLHASCKEDLHEKAAYLRCKFGFLCPNGYPPFGHYRMVYPADPSYFDQRDGQVYAAAGYNGPVSVPLAPNVGHTYNYGWGIPSSRVTPISRGYVPAQ